MKLIELTKKVKAFESELAYSSETPLWGDFLDSIEKNCKVNPLNAEDHDETKVDDAEALWWINAYEKYSDLAKDADYWSDNGLQDFYDSI